MVKKLRAIPKRIKNDKIEKKTLNAQPNIQKLPHEIYNTKNRTQQKTEC